MQSPRPHPGPTESESVFDTVIYRHVNVQGPCSKEVVNTGGETLCLSPARWRFSTLPAPSNDGIKKKNPSALGVLPG